MSAQAHCVTLYLSPFRLFRFWGSSQDEGGKHAQQSIVDGNRGHVRPSPTLIVILRKEVGLKNAGMRWWRESGLWSRIHRGFCRKTRQADGRQTSLRCLIDHSQEMCWHCPFGESRNLSYGREVTSRHVLSDFSRAHYSSRCCDSSLSTLVELQREVWLMFGRVSVHAIEFISPLVFHTPPSALMLCASAIHIPYRRCSV